MPSAFDGSGLTILFIALFITKTDPANKTMELINAPNKENLLYPKSKLVAWFSF
ncbi:MAG: hypothetical protein ACJASF_001639 [Vicingaceae bacterium]|jgi:hypothetical protein